MIKVWQCWIREQYHQKCESYDACHDGSLEQFTDTSMVHESKDTSNVLEVVGKQFQFDDDLKLNWEIVKKSFHFCFISYFWNIGETNSNYITSSTSCNATKDM